MTIAVTPGPGGVANISSTQSRGNILIELLLFLDPTSDIVPNITIPDVIVPDITIPDVIIQDMSLS